MRVISSVLFATLTCAVSHQTFGQPLKIDLAINGWGAIDHVQEILPAGSYAYGSGAIGLETKTSYFISGIGFSPFLHAHYHFPIFGIPTASEVDALVIRPNGWLLDFGVEKPFNIGYSTLALSFGVGVNWEEYKIDVPSAQSLSIRNDDIAYVAGDYPSEAIRTKKTGTVWVRAFVDTLGRVTWAEILKSQDDVFNRPSLIAMIHWRFKPALLWNDEPIGVCVSYPFRFHREFDRSIHE